MKSKTYAIGIMSGTSLDGVDLVYVSFDSDDYKNFTIIHAATAPYSREWMQRLQNAIHSNPKALESLDILYGQYLGDVCQNFINNYKIDTIDFIASHGHTISHKPNEGITLQIGNGQEIANKTGQKVVCDFRTQDVKLGGQGAPLVPIGDELLFSNYEYCLNLGGFSNISFNRDGKRIAFDICPVNIVLNHYAQKLGVVFDKNGELASQGNINQNLLAALNDLEFYKKQPPKSLGLEWVQEHIFPLIHQHEEDEKNILSTFVEHIAMQIGKVIFKNNNVLVTGGGTFNKSLIQRIEHHAEASFDLPDEKLINFKEALVFGFLGLLRLNGEVNCLQSVTGASKNHSSGVIFST